MNEQSTVTFLEVFVSVYEIPLKTPTGSVVTECINLIYKRDNTLTV